MTAHVHKSAIPHNNQPERRTVPVCRVCQHEQPVSEVCGRRCQVSKGRAANSLPQTENLILFTIEVRQLDLTILMVQNNTTISELDTKCNVFVYDSKSFQFTSTLNSQHKRILMALNWLMFALFFFCTRGTINKTKLCKEETDNSLNDCRNSLVVLLECLALIARLSCLYQWRSSKRISSFPTKKFKVTLIQYLLQDMATAVDFLNTEKMTLTKNLQKTLDMGSRDTIPHG